MQFLDTPGEWYLNPNTNEVYYMPRANENLLAAEVIAPRLETLINVKGTVDQKARNLVFEGLTFSYSTWMYPLTNGWIGGQAIDSSSGAARVPEGVVFENADTVFVRDNIFTRMGASGLGFYNAVQNSSIDRNIFVDIGGSGISIGRALRFIQSDRRLVVYNNAIRNNLLAYTGQVYTQTTGIFAGYVDSLTIENNELMEMPYTGISLGWGWTYSSSDLKNNIMRRNHIHNVMNLQDDGGAYYLLSSQPGTVISENYIHDMPRLYLYKGSFDCTGIYLDAGVAYVNVTNNLIMGLYHPTSNADTQGYLNTFSNNFIDMDNPTIRQNAGPQTLSAEMIAIAQSLMPRPRVTGQWTMDSDSISGTSLNMGGMAAYSNELGGVFTVGTMTGVSVVPGRLAQALSFANPGSNVRIPSAYITLPTPRLDAWNFTWTAWVKPGAVTSSTTPEWIISKNGNETNAGFEGLAIVGGEIDRHFSAYLNIPGGATNVQIASSLPGSVIAGQWYMVAVTYDGGTLSLYINGQFAGSKFIGLTRTPGTGMLVFGQRPDGVGNFNGLLDDVKFWDRALSAADLRKATESNAAF